MRLDTLPTGYIPASVRLSSSARLQTCLQGFMPQSHVSSVGDGTNRVSLLWYAWEKQAGPLTSLSHSMIAWLDLKWLVPERVHINEKVWSWYLSRQINFSLVLSVGWLVRVLYSRCCRYVVSCFLFQREETIKLSNMQVQKWTKRRCSENISPLMARDDLMCMNMAQRSFILAETFILRDT